MQVNLLSQLPTLKASKNIPNKKPRLIEFKILSKRLIFNNFFLFIVLVNNIFDVDILINYNIIGTINKEKLFKNIYFKFIPNKFPIKKLNKRKKKLIP